MINVSYIDTNRIVQVALTREHVSSFLAEKRNPVWFDFSLPTAEEFELLRELFGFHPLTVDACQKFTDWPKIEEFEEYLFIILRDVFFTEATHQVEHAEIDAFLGKNYLVTVHVAPSSLITELEGRLLKTPPFFNRGPDFLLYLLTELLCDHAMQVLDHFDDAVESLEQDVLTQTGDCAISKTLALKKEILDLRKSLTPQRDVINRLCRRDISMVSTRNMVYFRDTYDHMMRIYELLEVQQDLITSVFEVYLSALSNKLNEVMKRLTIVTTVFMPLTLIAGIYGMNFNTQVSFWNMPELNSKYGYISALGLMLLVAFFMLFYFRRKKWL